MGNVGETIFRVVFPGIGQHQPIADVPTRDRLRQDQLGIARVSFLSQSHVRIRQLLAVNLNLGVDRDQPVAVACGIFGRVDGHVAELEGGGDAGRHGVLQRANFELAQHHQGDYPQFGIHRGVKPQLSTFLHRDAGGNGLGIADHQFAAGSDHHSVVGRRGACLGAQVRGFDQAIGPSPLTLKNVDP